MRSRINLQEVFDLVKGDTKEPQALHLLLLFAGLKPALLVLLLLRFMGRSKARTGRLGILRPKSTANDRLAAAIQSFQQNGIKAG
jgi:hypothetical protein